MQKNFIARTGRVDSWLKDQTSRLPVSCTVFCPTDSMTGVDGLEASWTYVSYCLRHGAGVAVHLSKLRPNGSNNGKGLTSSGPVSFAKVYSCLNEVLRRGGVYKNGAVVVTLDANHEDLLEFITAPRAELPWVKRCVNITQEWWNHLKAPVRAELLLAIKKGDVWLAKVKYDQKGERIFSNVCLEIFIKSRASCLLEHVNLGQCEPDDLTTAFTQVMTSLCELHPKTGVGESGHYLGPDEDRQVGLGMLGLANLLASQGVSYAVFGEALYDVLEGRDVEPTPAYMLATKLQEAISAAASIARANRMDRAFCIAPTATCSYKYTDLQGYTTTPEIAPPISRAVDRDSGTFGVESFSYPPTCETASEVGWDAYKLVSCGICQMLENTGLFHGYSWNTWSDMIEYNDEFIQDWLDSPLTSMYYALQVQPDTLRKDDVEALLDEQYKSIFNIEDTEFCVSCAE